MKRYALMAAALAIICAMVALVLQPTSAQEEPTPEAPAYIGSQACSGCHRATYDEWLLTPHRRTLAEGRQPDRTGCESCHGPGGPHVRAGGDPRLIVRLSELEPRAVSDICLKCHQQEDVMLYRTSPHSMGKVKCTSCHSVHMPGRATMLRNIDAQKESIRGLARQIQDTKQRANTTTDEDEKSAALAEVRQLEARAAELRSELDVVETRTRRAFEPELCYSCHKEQEAQFRLPTHHPVPEARMQCSDCHNPHGGAKGNLREETISQTCFRCHPEYDGPFVFEHPPVSEDCTICHRPHGSAQNHLLKQSEPFVCLKCHAGPHSRTGTLAAGSDAVSTSRVPYFYWQCTSCHNRPHGSDRHPALHY